MSRYFRRVLSRGLKTSTPHTKGDLVGPPDPLSNLRPVVYGGVPGTLPPAIGFYSEAELRGTQHDPHEFSLNFAKAQLDALNHAYWTDSNHRFQYAQEAFLHEYTPPGVDYLPRDKRDQLKERLLSQFYACWVVQERERHRTYARKWIRGQYGIIWLSTQVTIRKFLNRMGLGPWSQPYS